MSYSLSTSNQPARGLEHTPRDYIRTEYRNGRPLPVLAEDLSRRGEHGFRYYRLSQNFLDGAQGFRGRNDVFRLDFQRSRGSLTQPILMRGKLRCANHLPPKRVPQIRPRSPGQGWPSLIGDYPAGFANCADPIIHEYLSGVN